MSSTTLNTTTNNTVELPFGSFSSADTNFTPTIISPTLSHARAEPPALRTTTTKKPQPINAPRPKVPKVTKRYRDPCTNPSPLRHHLLFCGHLVQPLDPQERCTFTCSHVHRVEEPWEVKYQKYDRGFSCPTCEKERQLRDAANALLALNKADKKLADKKLAEKVLAEKKLADKKLADKKLADKKLVEKKLAAVEKKLADKKRADNLLKMLADKKLADKKLAKPSDRQRILMLLTIKLTDAYFNGRFWDEDFARLLPNGPRTDMTKA